MNLSNAEAARSAGYAPSSVGDWIADDVMPGAAAIKAILRSAKVWDVDRALSWLADGEGREPYWLSDKELDPFTEPTPPRGAPPEGKMIVFPFEIVRSSFLDALNELEVARASGVLREPSVIHAWTALERGVREIPGVQKQLLPRLDSNQDLQKARMEFLSIQAATSDNHASCGSTHLKRA